MARTNPTSRSLPALIEELWQLVVTYVKQETVEPVKGLGRFVAFGVAGSFCLGLGVVLLLIAGLRVLQTETDTTFTGNLTWVPYLIVLVVALLIILLAVSRVGKAQKRGGAK